MDRNRQFQFPGGPSFPQNGSYPELDPVIPPLYPWMIHQQHILPDHLPSASQNLVFEGFIPDPAAQNVIVPTEQQNPLDPVQKTTLRPPLAHAWSGETDAYTEDESDLESTTQGPGTDHEGGVYSGTRSHRGGRSLRNHPASRKTGFRGRGGWSKGLKLGPRRAIEPSDEFNKLHQQATNAFIDQQDPETAMTLIRQAIAINPEMFSAHALLSEIYFSMDDSKLAIDTLFIGAHACPKDPDVWQQIADACLQRSTYDRETSLEQALQAFGRLVQIDRDDHDSRFQRAAIWKELGKYVKAVNELHVVLRAMPFNSSVLKLYAEVCIEWGQIDKALQLFKEAIEYYQTNGFSEESSFSWADVNVYVDLVARNVKDGVSDVQAVSVAIKALKKLSRWLLGRDIEDYWDKIEDDDREWDADEEPRRTHTYDYLPGRFDTGCYGIGLPLELRVRLGFLRLRQGTSREEAIAHFEWLEPEDHDEDANIFHFSDLFHDVGLALYEAKEHDLALRYLEPLKDHGLDNDISFWLTIGDASYVCGKKEQAFECYEEGARVDEECIEARTWLSKLYTERGEKESAIKYAKEAIALAQESIPKTPKRKYERKDLREARVAAEAALKQANKIRIPKQRAPRKRVTRIPAVPEIEAVPKPPKPIQKAKLKLKRRIEEKESVRISKLAKSRKPVTEDVEATKHEKALHFYTTLVNNTPAMRAGNNVARAIWMDCAKALLADFRRNRSFYSDRRPPFVGFRKGEIPGNAKTVPLDTSAGGALNEPDVFSDLGQDNIISSIESASPATFRDINFTDWFNFILEYAVLLVNYSPQDDAKKDCYTAITTALECTGWNQNAHAMLQIYACYLTCALGLRDEQTVFNVVLRWFMREFQFCTDAYRLFAAVNLFFPYPNNKAGKEGQMNHAIFKGGPFQKFLFRQILSVDYQLPLDYNMDGEEGTAPAFMRKERGEIHPTQREDESAGTIIIKPEEMDVVLLTIYGHILYAAGSFLNALSYLYRAHTLDPNNPTVLLSMALSYMHQMFKRQNENRHIYVLQGWACFQAYAEARTDWAKDKESGVMADVRREIEFNRARCWHMLGMTDLALESYHRLLFNSDERQQETEYSMETAYAMQTIYALSGNMKMAKQMTEKYLVVE